MLRQFDFVHQTAGREAKDLLERRLDLDHRKCEQSACELHAAVALVVGFVCEWHDSMIRESADLCEALLLWRERRNSVFELLREEKKETISGAHKNDSGVYLGCRDSVY